jgi:hypothetical protein
MKIACFTIGLVISTVGLLAAESAENLASHFASLPLSEKKIENLPKGREQEVLNALIANQSVYLGTLLRLNHAPTVERVMTKFASVEGKAPHLRGRIEASGSPYIIDELVPALYKNDRIEPRLYGEGTNDYGESVQAAEIIGQLIIKAPEFPPEAKAWAKAHLSAPSHTIIQDARAWWELNRAALLANQFEQVRVPTATPAVIPAEEPPPKPAAPPASIKPPPEPAPAVVSMAVPTPPPAPVAPPLAKSSNPLWWIVGTVAALAAVVFVARRKKPKA